MLNDPISSFVISGCRMWRWLMGQMVFGFFLGWVVMYRCINHKIWFQNIVGVGGRVLEKMEFDWVGWCLRIHYVTIA